jgi:mono/diheme cytochrome c family protein
MIGSSTAPRARRALAAVLAAAWLVACVPTDGPDDSADGAAGGDPTGASTPDRPPPSPEPPGLLVEGRDLFDLHCAQCHGSGGFGTTQGPPLAHEIYRPGHHADISFHLAVQRGVRSHHWNFGDMPPQPNVPVDRIQDIVDYVRWVQREAGIR